MAQIVHDLAPGAAIDFATADGGEAVFAKHIKDLASAGADVIVDDIAYFGEPFFQDGPVAVAASEVEAEGVTYLSAAGNDNLLEGKPAISPPGKRLNSATRPAAPRNWNCCRRTRTIAWTSTPRRASEDDTFGITVEPEETLIVDLQWSGTVVRRRSRPRRVPARQRRRTAEPRAGWDQRQHLRRGAGRGSCLGKPRRCPGRSPVGDRPLLQHRTRQTAETRLQLPGLRHG